MVGFCSRVFGVVLGGWLVFYFWCGFGSLGCVFVYYCWVVLGV